MKIRMKVQLVGTHPDLNGDSVAWPPAGSVLDISDREGAKLCAAGLATPVADKDADVERAVVSEKSEKRGLTKESMKGE